MIKDGWRNNVVPTKAAEVREEVLFPGVRGNGIRQLGKTACYQIVLTRAIGSVELVFVRGVVVDANRLRCVVNWIHGGEGIIIELRRVGWQWVVRQQILGYCAETAWRN